MSFCTGAASKRFGIDGDREAVPLVLEVVYNRVNPLSVCLSLSVCVSVCLTFFFFLGGD